MREIIAPNSAVSVSGHNAIVLEVALKSHATQYRVAWWNGATRVVEWLEEVEIDPPFEKTQIGFKKI